MFTGGGLGAFIRWMSLSKLMPYCLPGVLDRKRDPFLARRCRYCHLLVTEDDFAKEAVVATVMVEG
jgi:hypothetical protein